MGFIDADRSTRDDGAVDPRFVYEHIRDGEPVTILDVRGPSEFEEWRIDGPTVESVNVPGTEFETGLTEDLLDELPDGEPLIVVCAKGISSEVIAEQLRGEGVDARNMAEGMEGWARVYVSNRIDRYDGNGTLYQYHRPSSGCLGYLLVSDGEAAVFDPLRAFVDRYREDVADANANLEYAIDTHVHADHFSGVRELTDAATVGILPDPAIERGVTYTDEIRGVSDGETITVGNATIDVVHTPGHTTGMTSYLIDESVLLTGDGLFTDSIARPDLEAGDDGAPDASRTLYETLQNVVLAFPDDVIVAGGHASEAAERTEDGTYTARLGDLRESMPILSRDRSTFVELVLADMPPRPSNYQSIIAANLGQQDIDGEQAFQLELGPNNCASSTETLKGQPS